MGVFLRTNDPLCVTGYHRSQVVTNPQYSVCDLSDLSILNFSKVPFTGICYIAMMVQGCWKVWKKKCLIFFRNNLELIKMPN